MNIKRGSQMEYVAASHEDPKKPGVLKRVLFSREELSAGRVQMVNWSLLPVGSSFRAHYHEDMEEVFIVLNGSALMTVGTEELTLVAGDAVSVAAGEVHTMVNTSQEPVQYLVFGITGEKNGKTVVV